METSLRYDGTQRKLRFNWDVYNNFDVNHQAKLTVCLQTGAMTIEQVQLAEHQMYKLLSIIRYAVVMSISILGLKRLLSDLFNIRVFPILVLDLAELDELN